MGFHLRLLLVDLEGNRNSISLRKERWWPGKPLSSNQSTFITDFPGLFSPSIKRAWKWFVIIDSFCFQIYLVGNSFMSRLSWPNVQLRLPQRKCNQHIQRIHQKALRKQVVLQTKGASPVWVVVVFLGQKRHLRQQVFFMLPPVALYVRFDPLCIFLLPWVLKSSSDPWEGGRFCFDQVPVKRVRTPTVNALQLNSRPLTALWFLYMPHLYITCLPNMTYFCRRLHGPANTKLDQKLSLIRILRLVLRARVLEKCTKRTTSRWFILKLDPWDRFSSCTCNALEFKYDPFTI